MFGSRAPRWSCTSFCLEMQNPWQKFTEKIDWRILKKVQPKPLNWSVCERLPACQSARRPHLFAPRLARGSLDGYYSNWVAVKELK